MTVRISASNQFDALMKERTVKEVHEHSIT